MEARVSENFIVLTLNPRSGNFMIFGNYLKYGMIGAILMDLVLAKKITVNGHRISATEGASITGIEPHDKILGLIAKAGRPLRIRSLLGRISIRSGWYVREFRNILIEQGIVRAEHKRFMFISYKLHYLTDPGRRTRLIYRLRDILLYNKIPDEAEIMTLGLSFACKLHRGFSDDHTERRSLRQSLKNFARQDVIASDINRTIMEVQAAITASITASIAATSGRG